MEKVTIEEKKFLSDDEISLMCAEDVLNQKENKVSNNVVVI